jgi:uncharacterized protein (DUF1330 family)
VVTIEDTDLSGFNEYKQLAPLAVKPYGGKYLVRGGLNETLEGDWCTQCLVILEFDSSGRAKEWLNSPAYS